MTTEEWNTYLNGHWYFNGAKQDKHLAMFPEELPKRLIKMFSFPQETILDPFMGSGTTATVAKRLNRNSIGYEINPDFIPIIKEKIGQDDFYSTSKTTVIKQEIKIDIDSELESLPYKFVDVHKIEKKMDVKQLQFGSKIDKDSSTQREEYFIVKQVISPELVLLNNGMIVRLIGIRQNPEINGKATEFLAKKTLGKKVYLRFDEKKYDDENHLLVYLYLENKTFINAHLIKEKMALCDETSDYKMKSKFEKL